MGSLGLFILFLIVPRCIRHKTGYQPPKTPADARYPALAFRLKTLHDGLRRAFQSVAARNGMRQTMPIHRVQAGEIAHGSEWIP
ncbi:hypothetical protein AC579_3430 [Pseudocercospora musae]|uniref:Uncharacterized protein n=1 Tax=Pseudocercospora musae TaxID=113226 RepID=A0A139I3E8_9PEZI|nr:hypothetical protein AC579_3430 [Pseudocercospora musae]